MPDILIHDYCKKDFEDLLELARYGANNAMIGVNMKWEELPPHGDLIDRDAIKYVTLYGAVLGTTEPIINEQPVVVPAERRDET